MKSFAGCIFPGRFAIKLNARERQSLLMRFRLGKTSTKISLITWNSLGIWSTSMRKTTFLMEDNGISTRQMSRILGKDESIVSKILKGQRSTTIEHARKLGHHFGVNPKLF